jgi:ureidoacrylate peracid hydrolase
MSKDVISSQRKDQLVMLKSETTAVLVVDMVNDFCTEGGVMVTPGVMDRLGPPQNAIIKKARESGSPIIFIMDSHRSNVKRDREFLKRPRHCVEGEWGAQISDVLDKQDNDIYVVKRRYSGFFNTDLDLTLRDMQIDTLIVMGVVTNVCVRSTVHDAFFLGYTAIVPEDCVEATGAREQISSLYDISSNFGVVSDSAAVISAFSDGAPIVNKEIPE